MPKNHKPATIMIRELAAHDCALISAAFAEQGWNKPTSQFERYLSESQAGKRRVLIAEVDGEFGGYLTVLWESEHPTFHDNGVPEITDLNVLIKFRRRGVATALIKKAENVIGERSGIAGIRVGTDRDYGPALRLYVLLGYVPDGSGLWYLGRQLSYGEEVIVDNDLTLALTKSLDD